VSALFDRQLATYAGYHRDLRNRVTHFIGIPAILLSLLMPLALWRVPVAGLDVSAACIVAAAAACGWIALDRAVGIAMLAVLTPMLLIAEWIARRYGVPAAWWSFAVLFAGGWALQILGHAAFEGRRPALVDNLFQAFIGPMFLIAELMTALGLRRHRPRASALPDRAA
jgi:uncharacterized membrane protein YGL010W